MSIFYCKCCSIMYFLIGLCEMNESFPNQVLFALGQAGLTLAPTRTDLLNPSSGRDASHPCLISTWPKEGYTIVCVIRASLKNYCYTCSWQRRALRGIKSVWSSPKADNTFDRNCPQKRLFVGGTNLSPSKYCLL